jgi:hypothetical protein
MLGMVEQYRRQTWEDVERSAEFRAGIDEAINRYRERVMNQAEVRPGLLGWLFLLLLGAFVSHEDEESK